MPLHVLAVPISGLREGESTYALYEVPDRNYLTEKIVKLTGDYSWTGLPVENIKYGANEWETFRDNEDIQALVESPTACYVDICNPQSKKSDADADADADESNDDNSRIVFYRDQQDCVVWSVDPETGKVYSDRQVDPIADTVEEFWFRQWAESRLWYHYCHPRYMFSDKRPSLPENGLLRSYAEFYLQKSRMGDTLTAVRPTLRVRVRSIGSMDMVDRVSRIGS